MVSVKTRPQGILSNIITYLCFKARPLSERKLLKLVYLVDIYHCQMFGERLTQVPFKHYYYGVWAPDVGEELERLCSAGIIVDELLITRAGLVACVPKPKIRQATISLSDSAFEALRGVIADWGAAPPDEVVNYTKTTLPFLGTPFNQLIDFRRINFALEYAKSHGVSVEEAATKDILQDPELVEGILNSEEELRQ
jgi:hypothetical protein